MTRDFFVCDIWACCLSLC